ncbi:hypothetical protein ACHAPT_012633 [Fusarium lateritium]
MSAATILASFDEPMPIRTDPIANEPEAHVSDPSTDSAKPPKFGLCLQDFFARSSTAPLNHSCLEESYLTTWEETRSLLHEADVSDASASQLINPVNLALSAHHPRQVFQRSQEAFDATGALARAYKTWHRYLDGGILHFAVLDYQRPGVIRPQEFAQALCKQENFSQQLAKAGKISTLFSRNSHILLKQAVNYSRQYKTKYIALFDWDALLLIYLEDAKDMSGGTWCCIELLTDRSRFRRALLGFLEAAYQSRRGHGHGGPAYPTA